MDLGAYVNIDNLAALAEANGISVPRLRGYRWMKNEQPYSKEQMAKIINESLLCEAEDFFRSLSYPRLYSMAYEYSWKTDARVQYFMETENNGTPIGIRWHRLHGKARRNLKLLFKQSTREHEKQMQVFNKYCGREDVLYIHTRIGGNNWNYYDGDHTVANQPWFLEKVDDAYDRTYCDIYAKLNILEVTI